MTPTTPSSATAEHLRHRAVALRALARAVQHLDVLDLFRHTGTDVWVGPSQQHWYDTLHSDRAALLRESRDLLSAAHRLERRADDLERLAVVTAPHVA